MPIQDQASVYDAMRRRAQQQSAGQAQEEQDALKRRFAAQGGLNSGAYIKTAQQATDQGARRAQDATMAVDAQEAQYQQHLGDQAYGTKEREASQQFTKGMADEQLAFQKDVFGKEFGESQFANQINAMTALKNSGISSSAQQQGYLGILSQMKGIPLTPEQKRVGDLASEGYASLSKLFGGVR